MMFDNINTLNIDVWSHRCSIPLPYNTVIRVGLKRTETTLRWFTRSSPVPPRPATPPVRLTPRKHVKDVLAHLLSLSRSLSLSSLWFNSCKVINSNWSTVFREATFLARMMGKLWPPRALTPGKVLDTCLADT